MKRFLYSVAMRPSQSVVNTVRQIKLDFPINGYFGSKNSEAHLTILEFVSIEKHIPKVVRFMGDFTNAIKDHLYKFAHYSYYPEAKGSNGTFYIQLDIDSEILMTELFKSFQKNFPNIASTKIYKVAHPHMTIARQLSQKQIENANLHYVQRQFDLSTNCTLVLRRKSVEKAEQFSILYEFSFMGEDNTFNNGQLSAF